MSNGKRCGCGRDRYYLVSGQESAARLEKLVGRDGLHVVVESGGKVVLTNLSLP